MRSRFGQILAGLGLGWACQAGGVIINEIMFHPGFGEVGDPGYVAEDRRKEYIELFNQGSVPVLLKGWRFTQGVALVFPEVTILPGGYLVAAADTNVTRFKEAYAVTYPQVASATVVGGWTGTLSDGGEAIRLEDNLGQQVDAVTYSAQGDWAVRRPGDPFPGNPAWWRGWQWTSGADAGGKSLELINPQLPRTHGQNWGASLNEGGTPGGPNSVASTNVPPLILDVRHRPAVPKSTEPVTITARILDELTNGVAVTLWHRPDGEAAFVQTAMLDDGQHGDGLPGDGVFGAVLATAPDLTVVEFYVQASDAQGQSRIWPGPTDAEGAQGADALYQVDDSTYAGDQPIYRLILRASEWDAWTNLMDNVSNGRHSDAEMNGTLVTVDGGGTEVRYNVGVRNRGKGTRAARPHNLHVSIPKDRPWRGRTGLDLNTRTVHSQVAGNALASLAGLPNTYGAPIQVRVNGSNLAHLTATGSVDSYQFGSYYGFEPYGSEWTKLHLPADPGGNLYKGAWYFDWVKLANNGADLRYLGEDVAAYRQQYSAGGPTSSSGAYVKQSNTAEDDWSDLIGLVRVLNTAPDATYLQEVEQVVNVDEWLRYLAFCSLAGNMETTLATGIGDDYSMYRGVADPRFQLLIHDLDTTMGQGDVAPDYSRSIFKAADLAPISRLLKHPAVAPRYYALLKELADTVFAPEQANAVLDQWLGAWVPQGPIQSMKDFVAQRRASVLAQIPQVLTITTSLPVASGYARTTNATAALSGKANAIQARAVLVNGAAASWTQWSASWSASNVRLSPGLNRVVVQALDRDNREIDRSSIDLWCDPGSVKIITGGALTADATWTADQGPYQLTGLLTIPAGRTLAIGPGTTVYVDAGAGLIINGQLRVQGTEYQRVRLSRRPGSTGKWGGLQFAEARQPNVLAYADLEFGDARSHCIDIHNSQVLIDHVTFFNMSSQYLDIWEPQVTIRHSVFGDLGGAYHIMAEHMLPDGWYVVDSNLFGNNSGDVDIMHLNRVSVKDGPRATIVNNVFTGAGDDILEDNETDTHLEGNLFMHANVGNPGRSASAAVATGPGGGAGVANLTTQHLTVVRNVFYQNDYAILSKTGAFSQLYNNVFVGNRGAILLDEPWRSDSGPGRAAEVESCIFWHNQPEDEEQASGTFVYLNNRALEGHTQLMVKNSLLPAVFHRYGNGNIEADPLFVSPTNTFDIDVAMPRFSTGFEGFDSSPYLIASGGLPDMRLKPGSPAAGAGFNGVDMGAYVSTNASLSGLPRGAAWQTNYTVQVAGTDIAGYKYRLIERGFTNTWSPVMAQVKTVLSITRSGATARATVAGHGYRNGDTIEIRGADREAYNGTFLITNVLADTFEYTVNGVLPDQLPPNDITCRKPEPILLRGLSSGTHTLQVVKRDSLGVWQPEDAATAATWTVDTVSPGGVRLNEILARNRGAFSANGAFPDAVELYNDGPRTADLGGMSLAKTTNTLARFIFPPGTALESGRYLVLLADTNTTASGFHLGFKLSQEGDSVCLLDKPENGAGVVDSVSFGLQLPDLSIGRLADGAWGLTVPTLGGGNVAQPVGDPGHLRVNEWLVGGDGPFASGFVELYNPEVLPVPLGGLYLTPGVVASQAQHPIPALSFAPAQGFVLFYPDNQPSAGADHLHFTLGSLPGALGLFSPDLTPIDAVVYGSQRLGIAQGRQPNGANQVAYFAQPSPGLDNPPGAVANTNVITQVFTLVTMTNLWSYNQSGTDLGTSWHALSYPGESAWPTGRALLYAGSNTYPAATNTALSLTTPVGARIVTYYLRSHFEVTTNLATALLEATTVVDDGAVVYLNGERVLGINMTNATVSYSTRPSATVSSIALQGPTTLRTNNLIVGDNVLAVEVHQISDSSHDIAFGLKLTATLSFTNSVTNLEPARVVLSEILANNRTLTNAQGAVTDWIELHNPWAQTIDLANLSLTDEAATPRKWVFPANSLLPPGEYWVVACDPRSPASAANTGFGLNAEGGSVHLFSAPAPTPTLLETISYGLQAADFSIGRMASGGAWILTVPTPGAPNSAAPLGDPAGIRVNEWMANPVSGDDWFELYHPGNKPVDLSGLFLTDDLNNPVQYRIPALSALGVGPGGYQVFRADNSPLKGANHTNFRLAASGETIGLFTAHGELIDGINFGPQRVGVSEGRLPDGSTNLVAFDGSSTPGQPNALILPILDTDGDGMPDTWEFAHGFNRTDPSDAQQDIDGDGLTNLQEYLAGTDPWDRESGLRLESAGLASNPPVLRFSAVPGRSYEVQFRDSLTTGAWQKLTEITAQQPEATVPLLGQGPLPAAARYYRVMTR